MEFQILPLIYSFESKRYYILLNLVIAFAFVSSAMSMYGFIAL